MNKSEILKTIPLHLEALDQSDMNWFFKGVAYIGLSLTCFEVDEDQQGLDILMEIPSSFYEHDMLYHLKTNKDFLTATLLLIDAMARSPFIPKDSTVMKAFFKLKGQDYGNA
jgi:hypothetical protein